MDAEVQTDGRIKYYINITGADTSSEVVVDPENENEMRAIRQLHLVRTDSSDSDSGDRSIAGTAVAGNAEAKLSGAGGTVHRLEPTGS